MARDERLTNFEKIKSLSIDEMAKMINKFDYSGITDKICLAVNPKQNCDTEDTNQCIDCIKKWLLSEVE